MNAFTENTSKHEICGNESPPMSISQELERSEISRRLKLTLYFHASVGMKTSDKKTQNIFLASVTFSTGSSGGSLAASLASNWTEVGVVTSFIKALFFYFRMLRRRFFFQLLLLPVFYCLLALAVVCWLLAVGCWLLAVGCFYWLFLLAVFCWLLSIGHWVLSIGCCLLAIVCCRRLAVFSSSPPSASRGACCP
jgi:hypothetical protein